MREILFRGKCIDETCLKGQWLAGQILHDGVTGKYYIHMDNCLNESDNVGEEGLLRFVAYEVDPETICQYIDLIGKNGRKIFEGDIVKAKISINDLTRDSVKNEENIYEVSYNEKYCYFYMKRKNNNLLFDGNWSYRLKEIEVIGNIFDNPELISDSKWVEVKKRSGKRNGKTDSM